ncbi:hypothetical protein PA905_37170 [Planktothrix agardhii CCAP 1459/11A]|uniref:Uncharacterized protein n=1 Tax=Planktothrix agardhii CCAP 1459/11A TaxID=282420 RepID=A0A4P5ZGX2_PLAAG|nr:hypothetical protein [Planktothrix agardhii]GDZ95420.1 hypothetical protein PA905_37170 [Planktothrix agardhii CCAP 1459/11A]CAD5925354.1 hypothetical protein NO365_00939 [Planktothrix agardhii]
MIKKLLGLASALEILTGLALIIAPSDVAMLLLGDGVSGIGTVVSRVASFGLFALGLACYPRSHDIDSSDQVVLGMLTYNILIAIYLIYLGIRGEWVGRLLWLAATLHTVFSILLTYAWFKRKFLTDLQPKDQ